MQFLIVDVVETRLVASSINTTVSMLEVNAVLASKMAGGKLVHQISHWSFVDIASWKHILVIDMGETLYV